MSMGIVLNSGKVIDLSKFKEDDVDIKDIAHHLAYSCRYNGATKVFFPIATHSVMVAQQLRDEGFNEIVQLAGLLHDSAEAYTGDIIRPIKAMIPEIEEFEYSILEVVLKVFLGDKITMDSDEWKAVVKADDRMLRTEVDYMMPEVEWDIPYESYDITSRPAKMLFEMSRTDYDTKCNPRGAERLFTNAFKKLKKEIDDDKESKDSRD